MCQVRLLANCAVWTFAWIGKSCPSCLLAIQSKIKSLPGVDNAVVMLKNPFGVSVVYHCKQTTANQILNVIKRKEPKVKIEEISVVGISSMPLPLIPPYVPDNKSTNSTGIARRTSTP